MTLVEFLHPLRTGRRVDQALAVLFYYKQYEHRDSATIAEIRSGLVRARIPQAKTTNIAQALTTSGPHAERNAAGRSWELTKTGEEYVRGTLGLAAATPVSTPESDVQSLRMLVASVSDAATRDYLEEAVRCLEVGARRAAVVFVWTGSVSTLRDRIWQSGPRQIETELQRHNPTYRFKKKDDFWKVKDADLLEVGHDLALYDASEKKRLKEALDLRNDCGHPVKYKAGEKKVASFIEDVVGIVWP